MFKETQNTRTTADHGPYAMLCARVESLALPKSECSILARLYIYLARFTGACLYLSILVFLPWNCKMFALGRGTTHDNARQRSRKHCHPSSSPLSCVFAAERSLEIDLDCEGVCYCVYILERSVNASSTTSLLTESPWTAWIQRVPQQGSQPR